MKAAVLEVFGQPPVLGDVMEPVINNDGEQLLQVRAAAIKNLDRMIASGTHYASYKTLPAVVGMDAVGTDDGGTLFYGQTIGGAVGQRARFLKKSLVKVPAGVPATVAAALPNAVIGAAAALKYKGKINSNSTVLINGATGITGKICVQLAKAYGAKEIIVTGRNQEKLNELQSIGAHHTILLDAAEAEWKTRISSVFGDGKPDIVIDYLWGKPMEAILTFLKGGTVTGYSGKTIIVTVGEMSGANITLTSSLLRSSDVVITGSGLGSLSPEELSDYTNTLLPEAFGLYTDGKLLFEVEEKPIAEITKAWTADTNGKRLVITL